MSPYVVFLISDVISSILEMIVEIASISFLSISFTASNNTPLQNVVVGRFFPNSRCTISNKCVIGASLFFSKSVLLFTLFNISSIIPSYFISRSFISSLLSLDGSVLLANIIFVIFSLRFVIFESILPK